MSAISQFSSYCILVLAVFGIFVNLASIVILVSKRLSQMFHHLLKIMAIYDLVVVVGCGLLYSLPKLPIFSPYSQVVFPVILPWLLPIVQIAMMSSVYCTVVMSFERYIRICHLCQLRQCSYITKENFKYYVLAIIILPILFYIPKFFEVRSHSIMWSYQEKIDCKNYVLFRWPHVETNSTFFLENVVNITDFENAANSSSNSNFTHLPLFREECSNFNFSFDGADDFVRNVTMQVQRWRVVPTPLRTNQMYYKVYCIGLNTFFASLLPMGSLLFLNVSTVITLRQMGRQQEAVVTVGVNGRNNTLTNSSSLPDKRLQKYGFFGRGSLPFNRVRFSYRHSSHNSLEPNSANRALNDGSRLQSDDSRRFGYNAGNGNRESNRRTQLKKRRSQSAHEVGIYSSSHDAHLSEDVSLPQACCPLMASNSNFDKEHMLHCCPLVPENGNGKLSTSPGIIVTRCHSFIESDVKTHPVTQSQLNLECLESVTENDDPNSATPTSSFRSLLNRLQTPTRRRHENVTPTERQTSAQPNSEQRSRENRLTRISLSIVWLFIFCHVWKLIPTIYEGVHEIRWDSSNESGKKVTAAAWPEWLSIINDVSHTLIVFNSAVNFLIYVTL